jgi:4-hydroxy-tetrahydrodipicolinate synthase
MTTSPWPAGLLTALVTPLKDDQINVEVFGELVERQITSGVNGLIVAGGTGEYSALAVDERKRLATEAIAVAAGRVPVIVQTGALTTRDAVALSQHAQSAGADAILVASPFGEAINWAERFHFYEVLTSAVDLPVMVYNTPPSGLLTFNEITALAELPHISAVKDSSGSPELMGDLVEWADGTDFGVYVGLDSLLYDALRTGARGAIFGAANLIPGPLSAVASSLRIEGPTAANSALWREIRRFLRFVEVSPNYMALCKAGLALQGLEVGPVREPYLMPADAEIAELKARLELVVRAFETSTLAAA